MGKTKSILIIIIAVIISVIISTSITFMITNNIKGNSYSNVKLSDFKIEYSKLNDLEKSMAAYPEQEMNGIITCSDTQNNYVVVIESVIKSTSEKSYFSVFVINGQGKFGTFVDSLNTTENTIIGFQLINK